MRRFFILLLLSQLAHVIKCANESHECIKDVEVSYTVTEGTPLENYGEFRSILKKLGVQGEMRVVTKTKLEARKVCCEGYQQSVIEGEGCQPVPITTTDEPRVSISSEMPKLSVPIQPVTITTSDEPLVTKSSEMPIISIPIQPLPVSTMDETMVPNSSAMGIISIPLISSVFLLYNFY